MLDEFHDYHAYFSKRCRGTGRYAFVEKGIPPTVQDDDFAVQNVYYEPTPPSPEGMRFESIGMRF